MGFRQALERGQVSMKQVHCSKPLVLLYACINEPIDLLIVEMHVIHLDLGEQLINAHFYL